MTFTSWPPSPEGLPRALIEAMAAGLPCIGTSVGGVPELLATNDLVPPRDPAALTAALRVVITDPARRDAMAAHNHEAAADFREAVLGERRCTSTVVCGRETR